MTDNMSLQIAKAVYRTLGVDGDDAGQVQQRQLRVEG